MLINYELIQNYNVPSPTATLTFGSLGSYNDLEVYIIGTHTSSSTVGCYVNGDTGNKYSNTGNSVTVGQSQICFSNISQTAATVVGYQVGTGSSFWRARLYFPEYRNTTYAKIWQTSSINRNGNQEAIDCVSQYNATDAITSLSFTCGSSFTTSTWVQIYGVKVS